ncbi:MAG: hypothetical protein AAB874_06900, partial [Patescibacteria group bacterium]
MSQVAIFYFMLSSLAGILTMFLFPLQLPRIIKLFAGPALGIVITTELILIISLLMGFSPLSIWFALILFILGISFVWISCNSAFPPHKMGKLGDIIYKCWWEFRNHWPLFFILFSIGSLVVYIFWTKVLAPNSFGLVTGGEGIYGDTALHSAYTMAIVEQGLPPTNPLFAHIPLIYPFLVNLFSASLVKLGMNLRFAFILPQLMYFLGFTTLFYWVAKIVCRFTYREGDKIFAGLIERGHILNGEKALYPSELRSKKILSPSDKNWNTFAAGPAANLAVFFAMLIFFLGWGLGFTQYLQTGIQSGVWEITREYTNNLPGFHMHNPLVGLIFPERSFLPGLFIGMLITLLCLDQYVIARRPDLVGTTKQSQPTTYNPSTYGRSAAGRQLTTYNFQLTTIGILLGILPLWHMHTFLFFGMAVGVWYLSSFLFETGKNIVIPAKAGIYQKRSPIK